MFRHDAILRYMQSWIGKTIVDGQRFQSIKNWINTFIEGAKNHKQRSAVDSNVIRVVEKSTQKVIMFQNLIRTMCRIVLRLEKLIGNFSQALPGGRPVLIGPVEGEGKIRFPVF